MQNLSHLQPQVAALCNALSSSPANQAGHLQSREEEGAFCYSGMSS